MQFGSPCWTASFFKDMDKGDKLAKDAINKMMEIAGHEVQFEDLLLEEDGWYLRYTMTQEQHDEWEEWFVTNCSKRLRTPKKVCKSEFSWFSLAYGLKIDPPSYKFSISQEEEE